MPVWADKPLGMYDSSLMRGAEIEIVQRPGRSQGVHHRVAACRSCRVLTCGARKVWLRPPCVWSGQRVGASGGRAVRRTVYH
eukprot:5711146-Prymnesium_polylepis.1